MRVGIDGVDGAGKTILADELAEPVKGHGRPVIRASIDGFHNPRVVRYRLGKESPEGYFRDSFNHDLLKSHLLTPLGPDGSRRIRRAAFDYKADTAVGAPEEFEVTYARMGQRDGISSVDPRDEQNRRYYEGQQIYLSTANPKSRADIVVDNNDLYEPFILD